MIESEVSQLSLVFVGNFNPSIIHPSWLVQKELIKESEGESAETKIVHERISKFSLKMTNFEVTENRFQIKTSDESFFDPARDLMASIFKILNETPVSALGINHIFHYEVNEEKYLEVGKKLVPFDNWKDILERPRVMGLELQDRKRDDDYDGYIRFKVTPSDLLDLGISLNINDHFNRQGDNTNTEDFVNLLIDNWDHSLEKAKQMVNNFWNNLND